MKKDFSIAWKSSTQARKQRKYRYKAPLHIRNKFMGAHLSKELQKKHNVRNITLKKGDKVKILRGQFKGHTGNIEKIDTRAIKIIIIGANLIKKDGTKTPYPIHPSNVMITDMNIDDNRRKKHIERKKK